MKSRISTESGSIYLLDYDARTWERVEETGQSGPLRTQSGKWAELPRPRVGEPLYLIGPPINPKADGRAIITSPVISIETEDLSEKCSNSLTLPPEDPEDEKFLADTYPKWKRIYGENG